MTGLAILGSTGSIGVSTLKVVAAMPERFRVVALAAGGNLERMEEQVRRFRPACVALRDAEAARELKRRLGTDCTVLHGQDGLLEVATHPEAELVVSALVGAVGLRPTYAALGSPDLIYAAGGGVMGHPDGPAAGVESLKAAWDAALSGASLEDYAAQRPVLARAMEAFPG